MDKKCPWEFTKSVHKNSPILQQKFTFYVHEKSATHKKESKLFGILEASTFAVSDKETLYCNDNVAYL